MGRRTLLCASALSFALALATAIAAPVSAETTGKTTSTPKRVEPSSNIVVSDTQIQLFKYALALRPEQERYWGPVETALRGLSKPPEQPSKVQRAGLGAGKKDNPDLRYKRLSAAAIPLIKTFDESQRSRLEMLSRTFGFEHWLAAR